MKTLILLALYIGSAIAQTPREYWEAPFVEIDGELIAIPDPRAEAEAAEMWRVEPSDAGADFRSI